MVLVVHYVELFLPLPCHQFFTDTVRTKKFRTLADFRYEMVLSMSVLRSYVLNPTPAGLPRIQINFASLKAWLKTIMGFKNIQCFLQPCSFYAIKKQLVHFNLMLNIFEVFRQFSTSISVIIPQANLIRILGDHSCIT